MMPDPALLAAIASRHLWTDQALRFAPSFVSESGASLSSKYQDAAASPPPPVSRDVIAAFEAALAAKFSGQFEQAAANLAALLEDGKRLSGKLRGEAYFQLADIERYLRPTDGAWLGHLVAALTFFESHPQALAELDRASFIQDANKPAAGQEGPRVLMVLGSNFATVAFANEMFRRFNIVGLIQQYAEFPVIPPQHAPAADAPPLGLDKNECAHFPAEMSVFGNRWNALFLETVVPRLYVTRGEANEPWVLDWIRALKPDIILSHGPERLRSNFIATAPLGGINVHWGLSPTYRGMHTVRWPLLHGKPEWVGVTIHRLDPGLDTGPILYQARPCVQVGDTIRQVEYRLTELACRIVPDAVAAVFAGAIGAVDQDLSLGRQYWLDEWSPRYDRQLSPARIAALFADYQADRLAREQAASLINPWPGQAG
jgi:folate-dependent phosphoribosylglycinamide formyltransferase PurN